MGPVVTELRRFLDARGLIGPGVAAVSGGADSVALLWGLVEVGVTDVTVAHFNHRLRGEESDADEAFVKELAGRLGVRFVAGGADVAAAGGNTEATARRLRYDWLSRVAAEAGAGWVATGHTADDQAETVLHRLIRGTGLDGLRGIATVRNLTPRPPSLRGKGEQDRRASGGDTEAATGECAPLAPPSLRGKGAGGLGRTPDPATTSPNARTFDPLAPPSLSGKGAGGFGFGTPVQLIRPMLGLTCADLLAYLHALRQPFRTDATNADRTLTRNRIRHELLPLLKTFNPQVVSVLGRLAEQAEVEAVERDQSATKLLADAELPRAGSVLVLDAATLLAAPPGRVRDALRRAWGREGWPVGGMTFAHWVRAAALTPGDYPGGVRLSRTARVVQLARAD